MNVIYDYPKSSCCLEKTCICKPLCGVPSNIGVYNCDKECFNDKFKDSIEPKKRCGFTYLNPEAYKEKSAYDFSIRDDCCNTFTSTDPRLIDVPRSFKMSLDRPPMDSSIKLNEIYCDENLIGYGKKYKTYSDISAGQILYYTDDSFNNPFYGPNFTTPSKVKGSVSFDPMGSLEINYEREACIKPVEMCGLSYLNDSTSWREDLTGLYTAQIREYDWNPRYNC